MGAAINHDDETKKKQEKANNSPSYRCAAIKYAKKHKLLTPNRFFVSSANSQTSPIYHFFKPIIHAKINGVLSN